MRYTPGVITGSLLLAWLTVLSMNGPRETLQTHSDVTTAPATAASSVGSATKAGWVAPGDMMEVKLPGGGGLNVPRGGMEVGLVNYLNGTSMPMTDVTLFYFDRLSFDPGRGALQPASQEQLINIATILKAYPQVTIHVSGHPDSRGDPGSNLLLCEERIVSVTAALVKLGIDPARMVGKGYGVESSFADDSTRGGGQSGRIWLRVMQK